MEKTTLTRFAETFFRWSVGGLFLYAGAVKAWNPAEFANDIANYQLVSWSVAVGTAFYLPWLEIFCGFALISGRFRSGALRLLILLMLLFLQALITAAARGLNIHCGCFGRAFATSNYALLFLRDFALLAALVWLLYQEWRERATEEERLLAEQSALPNLPENP